MAESLQQALRRQMLSAAAAGSAAFEISGTLHLSKPLQLYFMDHNNQPGCVSGAACTCISHAAVPVLFAVVNSRRAPRHLLPLRLAS
jgi:hypothetical protein